MKRRPLRGWRLLLFATCEQTSRTTSDEWDGPVKRDRWWAARLHRLACGPCRHEHRRMRWLQRLLDQAPQAFRSRQARASTASLSPKAASRLRAAVNEARLRERD